MIIRVDWKLFKAVYFRVYKGYRVYCQLYNSLIEGVQSDGIHISVHNYKKFIKIYYERRFSYAITTKY